MSSSPRSVTSAQSATPHEAAAIAAAIERFLGDVARPAPAAEEPRNAWQRAALLEGTGREPDAPSPWGDPHPWGA